MPRPPFFPRSPIEWHVHEPKLLRRLSRSLVGMAALTGLLVHLYRWLVLSHGQMRWWFVLVSVAGALVLLLGLVTAHLGNHPVGQWVWRAPLFAVVEGATEAAVSALLILAGLERIGTRAAHWGDWAALSTAIFLRHTATILAFSLLLAAVVQTVRFALLKREHRASMAMAVHEAREQDAESREQSGV